MKKHCKNSTVTLEWALGRLHKVKMLLLAIIVSIICTLSSQ